MNIIAGMGFPNQMVPLNQIFLALQPVMGLARYIPGNLFQPVMLDSEVTRVVYSNIPSSLLLLCMFSKVEPKLLLRAVIYWVRIVVITFFRHATVR